MLQQSQVKAFQDQVVSWQKAHGRHQLPWQQATSPYRVLVSELMLQQTQVSTVIPYFNRWMQSFPTIEALANASNDQVMAHWQGLGYYARARNLHKAAQYVSERGEFPATLTDLLLVPGVGRYTAGAVMSFAYDQYGPIVDGNVRRLYARYFAISGVTSSSAVDKQLWLLAEQLTPNQDCKSFAQGLLDLGATLCKPRQPLCEQCPLASGCQALLQNRVDELPTPKPKKVVPVKEGHFIWLQQGEQLYLHKRPAPGIWASLWSLPQLNGDDQLLIQARKHGEFVHQFTHYKLNATVWQLDPSHAPTVLQVQEQAGGSWYHRSQLAEVGLPAPIRSFIEQQAEFTKPGNG
ncbi:MAG: A/G-specific adenine glycosylase [Gammaproteobacteria bacterium]|jgi:A/G-specific adenine glycosylase|nr:A/G-specific adenine glycosylase [Gammaproteobacteria bacterium]MBU2428194.1 A/G-specific adenine glycosylase [Gammaproteobacteria bacterium]